MASRLQTAVHFAVLSALAGAAGAQELPVPCGGATCGPRGFISSGTASYVSSNQLGIVHQQSERAILNWQSFNIGANSAVEFRQPSASAAALNRIHQSDPSRILGKLSANGQVLLINQNGIVFGQGAQVNTRALTASTLDVTDSIFNGPGVVGAINNDPSGPVTAALPAFSGDSTASIRIEAGATLHADERIVIIGAEVENRGTLEAPGGQAILAASHDKVYLASDRDLRGLLVEVGTGGAIGNFGEILVERGNATLAGLAVNQSGRIRATTSVNVNGSIRLLARDKASPSQFTGDGGARKPVATRAGMLTLAQNSITEVAPELQSADTAIDAQVQPQSVIELMARTIEVRSQARVVAPGGKVTLTATSKPDQPLAGNDRNAQLHVAASALIDVSGDDSALVPMERNQGRIKLFGNELADAPVQRDGPLARQEIAVDLREGTPLTDTTRLREDVRRGVGERLSSGGQLTLAAEGDVVLQPGSTVNFSGGQVRYLDGFLETTKLLRADGTVVDIARADPNTPYAGIFGGTAVEHEKWGVTEVFQSDSSRAFHPGYVEGKDAGSLTIQSGGAVALQGALQGGVVMGRLQRSVSGMPRSGALSITSSRSPPIEAELPSLLFTRQAGTESLAFGTPLPDDLPIRIPIDQLRAGGINRLQTFTSGLALLPQDLALSLAPGGSLSMSASQLRIEGDIQIASGSVALSARAVGTERGSLEIASTARIDVSGSWVNDHPIANAGAVGNAPIFVDGGSVALNAQGDLTLAPESLIDVSAGARLASSGAVVAGRAGSIGLASRIPNQNAPTTLDLAGQLRGFGFGEGGTLSVAAAGFRIGRFDAAAEASAGEVLLPEAFFAQGGFGSFAFSADRGGFEVEPDTQLTLAPLSYQLANAVHGRPTGANLRDFSEIVLLTEPFRGPSSFAATVARTEGIDDHEAVLRIGNGSQIATDMGGSITLRSDSDLYVGGELSARGGAIELALGNPGAANERGFRADQALRLGQQAALDVRGTSRVFLDERGVRSGEILGGGSVTLTAARGYLITAPGSVIDVSGATQVFDLPGVNFDRLEPTQLASDAGGIRIRASEGALLFGELRAAAGGSEAAGGTLHVAIDATGRDPGDQVANNPATLAQFPETLREVVVGAPIVGSFGEGVAVPLLLNGKALVAADGVHRAGFDSVDLTALPLTKFGGTVLSPGAIRFGDEVTLRAGRSISLDAAVIASTAPAATIIAPYVTLGPADTRFRAAATAAEGGSQLRVEADHIDLRGNTVFSGFAAGTSEPAITLASRGDIRMIGARFGGEPARTFAGSLTSRADLQLSAAQLYPATLTEFSVNVAGENGRIVIEPAGSTSVAPLSAGGTLRMSAAEIVQGGVIRAPFGDIQFDASQRLELAPGSLTSTSGAGAVIPFGVTEFGESWIYPLGDVTRVLAGTPEKSVLLRAPDVSIAAGSTVDISGGGDLLTYEFIRGPGGSRDILRGDNPEGAFAILPASTALFGVFDPFESPSAGIAAASTILLGEGSGVAAGEYARLPARYALLPGAFLVVPVSGYDTIQPSASQVLPDLSTPVVAGKLGDAAGDSRAPRWSGYAVLDGQQVRKRAEYHESLASKFFATSAGTPASAGRLIIDAGSSIGIDGTLAAAAGSGGTSAQVDFVAQNLAVVAQRTSSQRVELVDAELQNFGAASLLIGGSRRPTEDGIELDIRARNVRVERGAAITAPEVILAASDEITVSSGAQVGGAGAASAQSVLEYSVSGDGAFARVSAGAQAVVERANAAGLAGRVTIEEGATLAATGSITLEASRDVVSAGDLSTSGGSLALTASLISIGNAPANAPGLVLSGDDLARFHAAELLLASRSTIDFHGAVTASLERARFDAAGFRAFGLLDGARVDLSAHDLALGNSRGAALAAAGTANGTLALNAETIELGQGAFDISGFSSAQMLAARELVGDRQASLHMRGDLSITTPRLAATAGADVSVRADGTLTTTATASPESLDPVKALGARLTLTAPTISHGSRIELPSGMVALNATGAGGVGLAPDSVIDTSGRDVSFGATVVGSRGGLVSLVSSPGGVSIADGARIDVSGGAHGGEAGRLSVHASAGQTRIASGATLRAMSAPGETGGAFELQTDALTGGFSSLNTLLNAGGFAERRTFSIRTGNVVIGAQDVVRTGHLDIAAEGGALDIAGQLIATSASGGHIRLNAMNDILLRGSARIEAAATGAGEDGGEVELATRNGRIDILATSGTGESSIDVSGDVLGGGRGGRVHVRAPRAGADAVGVRRLAGRISGASRVDIEAFRSYASSTIDSALIDTIRADTDAYMANAQSIGASLGVAGNPPYHLIPGVEIASSGNLQLAAAWDLSDWRYGAEAGVLTLRAAGDLQVEQSLSDGLKFQSVDFVLPERDVVQTGASWGYRLVAGAAADRADPLAVAGTIGSVIVHDGAHVRTGTADIQIAAADDVVLDGGFAAIYTVGRNRGTGVLDIADAEILLRGDFTADGGDIRVRAGDDIRGVSDRLFPDWLPRVAGEFADYRPGVVFPAAWAVDVSRFMQGIGTLGGGDIDIVAGGDLTSLTVALPTTGQPGAVDGSELRIGGGGSLAIDVAGDIQGGLYALGRGAADIRSGGSITSDPGNGLFPIVQLGDARAALAGRNAVALETVFNPTVAEQDFNQGLPEFLFFPQPAYFFTYTDRSAITLSALSGDVNLSARGDRLDGSYAARSNVPDAGLLSLFPGTLAAHSLQGDIRINSVIDLFPSATGTLELLAGGDITATGAGFVNLSDGDAGLLPDVLHPASVLNSAVLQPVLRGHARSPVHAFDDVPALIAARGTVGADGFDTLGFSISKQTRVSAGEDVSNLTLSVQHARAADVTVLEAGRDIVYGANRRADGNLSENSNRIRVEGPGRIDLLAGRDVDFGSAVGIETSGNLANPALAERGADISIWTGQATRPDYTGFINRYLKGPMKYAARLRAYLEGWPRDPQASDLDAFLALPLLQQRDFIAQVFFNEIREGGLTDFETGFAAIAALFPDERAGAYAGNLTSFLSRITTLDGGDITLLVPGGFVNAGVASSGSLAKRPDQLGIVTQREGDVSAFVQSDFLVNASRVFALDGGDILIWSSKADIDAGRGARSALAIPPPLISFDALGNVVVEFPPAISGSGIRTAVTTPGRAPGDVFLFAPAGVVDAGDAGIVSAGNITIAATEVLGADNIEVGGVAVGVPVDSGGLGASLAAVSSVASSASDAAVTSVAPAAQPESATPVADSVLGWLEVFIEGFGAEVCKPDDVECLRRQSDSP